MAKRLSMILLAVLLVFSIFTGCGSTSTTPSDSSGTTKPTQGETTKEAPQAAAAKEPVTIRILASAGVIDEITKAITPKCEAQGVKLDYESYDWNTYDGKQKIAMTSQGGDYDVIFLPGAYVNTWAKAKAIIPMDDFLKKNNYDLNDYYASVQKFSTSDGKYYIVPFSAEAMIYFYRKDIYEKEGLQPPKTIDEMYEIAKKLTKDGMYGIAYPGGPEEGSCSFWSYFLWSYGGTYFDKDWKPQINTPEAIESAEMFAKILQECAPKGVTTWQNEETVAAFSSGSIAAMIMWPGYWGTVTDKEKSKVWDKVAVAPVPVGPTGKAVPRFGTWGLAITASSKKVEAAEVYIKAFTDNEGLKEVAKHICTASKKVNNDPEVQKINPSLAASAGALEYADERPPIPEAQQYISIVGNSINSIVAGKEAKPVLDDANKKIYDIMQQAGYFK